MPYKQYPAIREVYQDVGWDPEAHKATVGGAQFQQGKIPGTAYDEKTWRHYVTDQSALDAAIRKQVPGFGQEQPKESTETTQPPQDDPFSLDAQMTQNVQDILGQIRGYTESPPQSVDDIMAGEAYQGMKGAIDQQTEQAMRDVKAQLAASGVLGEGSTPAVERMGHVGHQASQQLGQLIPQLVQAAQGQRQAGLQELISGLGAQTSAEQQAVLQALDTFSTMAPYQFLTEQQRQMLPMEWAGLMGEVPGGAMPESGGTVPARQYVEQLGGSITWRRAPDGGNIVVVNGKEIDVEGMGGQNIDGHVYLPQTILDIALGRG